MFKLAQFRKREQGNQQVPKYKTVPKLASEFSSCSHDSIEEKWAMFQAEQSFHRGITEKPMKNLLAEEITKEAVARKKASVMEKLMGRDGLGERQNLRLWDKYMKKTASGGADRNEKPHDSKPRRKNLVGKQSFRDMFGYGEASNVPDHHKSSNQSATAKFSKEELAFMHKKCEESRRRSEEIRRQTWRKSNQDLMEKFLQQQDSLFERRVVDMQGRPSSSQCSHIAFMKPRNSIKCEAEAKGWNTDLDASIRHDNKLLETSRGSGTYTSLRGTKFRLEAKEETNIPARRIVVLKPSCGQTDNATQRVSSHNDFRRRGLATNTREAGSLANNRVLDETKVSCQNCRESRETAKVITRQVRDHFGSLGNMHPSVWKSGLREYVEKCCSYMSDSDSEVVVKLTSKSFYSDGYDHDSTEISVRREAKKKMSERWKSTRGYIDVEGISQGSTLGEMLSNPDRPRSSGKFNDLKDLYKEADYTVERDTPIGISSRDGWKDEYLGSRRRSGSVPPSFGSRRHNSSENLEALCDERLLIHQRDINRDRSKASKSHVSHRESKSSRSNNKKLHLSQRRHGFTSKSTESVPEIVPGKKLNEVNYDLAEKKPFGSQISGGVGGTASVVDPNVNTDVIMSSDSSSELLPLLSKCDKINLESDDLVEEKPLLHKTPDGTSSTAVVDVQAYTDVIMCSDSSSELVPLLSANAQGDGKSSVLYKGRSDLQGPSNRKPEGDSNSHQFAGSEPELVPEASEITKEGTSNRKPEGDSDSIHFAGSEPELVPEASEITKEVVHHSPDSILEIPATEDSSLGSDSFDRVNADLQELRRHLLQLKSESGESYSDDKVAEEEEVLIDEEGWDGYDYWESLYISDLLFESGFYDTNPGSFISNCYSADSPLDPSLFDSLEKKYSDATIGPIARKLLFDLVNELLLEIYQSAMESCPWVKPIRKAVGVMWLDGGIDNQLRKLMDIHEKEDQKKVSDPVFDANPSWYEPREVDDGLVKQIQEWVLDDLINEVINSKVF